ncbi:hypothetical protein EDD11_000348 [Mortierella claussenii]|nr:hypothetical protein EDD11_000348 [Mortierella claussenii]
MTLTVTGPHVHIEHQGTIKGVLDPAKRVARFLNVPFGTVRERWRPAVHPEPWTGIRDATKQGPIPPQPLAASSFSRAICSYPEFHFDDDAVDFEEKHCLNLNIYVPEDTLKQATEAAATAGTLGGRDAGTGAVVIVYLYGGGFRDGANAMNMYDGTNLVHRSIQLDRPVIVVVLNYRLNFLGNFSCPELVAELASDPTLTTPYQRSAGNWSLQDQKLAFDWVHAHIGRFGGDASNITAIGQSVGAVSINYHMLIPQHRGLFHRAIMQSCSMNSAPAVRPEVEGRLYLDYLVEHFHIPPHLSGVEKLALLKKIPSKEMGLAADSPKLRMFTPYVDGVMVPEDVRLWVHKTEAYDHDVKSMMVGNMKDDGAMFVGSLGAATKERWPRVYEKFCPPDETSRELWKHVYGVGREVETDEEAQKVSNKVVEHVLFGYSDYSALRALSKRKDLDRSSTLMSAPSNTGIADNERVRKAAPAAKTAARGESKFQLFQYYFDRSIDAMDKRCPGWGAYHGADLVFLFGPDYALNKVLTEEEKQLSKRMQTMWIHFAYGEATTAVTEEGEALFPGRITRPVDEFEYHGSVQEAIAFTPEAAVRAEHASRQGESVLRLWERSEKWVHESRGTQRDSEDGLRAGLLCIALPSQTEWS